MFSQPSGAKIENQRFSVTVNEDASINVLDKKNGRIYRGLNSFVDRGEAGMSISTCLRFWTNM